MRHIHPCGFCGVVACDADCDAAKAENYVLMTDLNSLQENDVEAVARTIAARDNTYPAG